MSLNGSPSCSAVGIDRPASLLDGSCGVSVLLRAINNCPVSVMITNRNGDIEYVNPKFTDVTGYTSEEVLGKNPRVLKSGELPSGEYAKLWKTVLAGEEWSGLFHNRRKDGTLFWERAVISGFADETGRMSHLIAVKEDITERRRLEEELEFERNLLRALLDSVPDLICFKDLDSRFLRISRSLATRLGLNDPVEAEGKTDADFFSPAIAQQSLKQDQEVIRTGKPVLGKMKVGGCLASPHVAVCVNTLPLRFEGGQTIGTFGLAHDVTSELLAARSLRESEAKFRAVSQSSQFGIVMIIPGGIVTFWNEAATRIFGYHENEVIGKRLPQLTIPGLGSPDVLKAFEHFCRTGERTFEGRTLEMDCRTKEGAVVPVDASLASFQAEDGMFGVAIVMDVTKRRQMEQERVAHQLENVQAQKLESIGRLAAGVAHEINTPTQYVGDNLSFLRSAYSDLGGLLASYAKLRDAVVEAGICKDILREVDVIEKRIDLEYLMSEIPSAVVQSSDGISRISSIVHAMKNFSHPDAVDMKSFNLNSGIESTVTVARNEWKYVAEVDLQLEPSLPSVKCHPGQFNQVILNLVINAAHAIAEKLGDGSVEKGRITLSTRRGGDMVEIRIVDTGNGIPAHVKEKIFTPFFTTKPVGKGTGQGLALARSVIVEKFGGTIAFESEEGVGTCFIIRLPLEPSEKSEADDSR